jgi:hypothetical protein
MLGEKKEGLNRKERDLELCAVALVEAQSQGLNPQDNHDELMAHVMLHGLLWDTEVDHIIEAGWLATLVRDVSKVLEDLGMFPISGIPLYRCTVGDILGAVDIILECMKEAYDLDHDPWD